MAAVRRWYGDQSGELSCGGTSAAFTLASIESDAGSALEAYTGMPFMVARCTKSNERSATMNIDALGAKKMVSNGEVIQSHDLTAGQMFFFAFNPVANNIEVFNSKGVKANQNNIFTGHNTFSASSSFGVIRGPIITNDGKLAAHKNLTVQYLSAAAVSVTADKLILENSSGYALQIENYSSNAVISASGENGLDTGSETASAWYYIHTIAEISAGGTGAKAILSLNEGKPVLPSGNTFFGLNGAVRNRDGNFVNFRQINKESVLTTVITDYDQADAGTTAVTPVLSAPPNTVAKFHLVGDGANDTTYILVTEVSQTDSVPTASLQDMGHSTNFWASSMFWGRVNSSSQIRIRQSHANGDLTLTTHGWNFN